MAKAKVVTEFYKLVDSRYNVLRVYDSADSWKKMYWDAIDALRQSGDARVYIQRWTKWTINVEDLTFENRLTFDFAELDADQKTGVHEGESQTGEYAITVPQHMPPELSRYHPVNGWELPEEIEVG